MSMSTFLILIARFHSMTHKNYTRLHRTTNRTQMLPHINGNMNSQRNAITPFYVPLEKRTDVTDTANIPDMSRRDVTLADLVIYRHFREHLACQVSFTGNNNNKYMYVHAKLSLPWSHDKNITHSDNVCTSAGW